MKKIAIAQPTYLPWLGFFDLLDCVDEFVFLDSVQFERHSWQHRNRVKGPSGEVMLVVPVKRTGLDTTIDAAELADPRELLKHCKTIEQAYARAPYRNLVLDRIRPFLADPPALLVDLTIPLVEAISALLGVTTAVRRSSSLTARGQKDSLVRGICDEVGADVYLSAPGSRGYMEEGNAFDDRAVEVRYHAFVSLEYDQLHPPFLSHLAAIDVLMCEGPDRAREIMLDGRRPSTL